MATVDVIAGRAHPPARISGWRRRGTRSRRRRANEPAHLAAALTSARRPGGRIVICFSLANRPPPRRPTLLPDACGVAQASVAVTTPRIVAGHAG
jgi:hypothetical protein